MLHQKKGESMGILLMCSLISSFCFCADMGYFSEVSSTQKASISNALYVFENASDNMIMRQLRIIEKMLREHEHISTSDINVINGSRRHCLLRCALEHGMVDLFELACQKKCANMHAHEGGGGTKTTLFFHWLIETQPVHLIKQALDAGANPKEIDGLKQDAFAVAGDRVHIIELLQNHVAQKQHEPVDEQAPFKKHSRSQSCGSLYK